jgi:soluble P-type ATPase
VSDGRLALRADDGHVQVVQAGGDRQGHIEQLTKKKSFTISKRFKKTAYFQKLLAEERKMQVQSAHYIG